MPRFWELTRNSKRVKVAVSFVAQEIKKAAVASASPKEALIKKQGGAPTKSWKKLDGKKKRDPLLRSRLNL